MTLATASTSTWLIVMALFVVIVVSLIVIGMRQRPRWGLPPPKGPWIPPVSVPIPHRVALLVSQFVFVALIPLAGLSGWLRGVAIAGVIASVIARVALPLLRLRRARREGRAIFGDRMPADWREALEGWIDHRLRDRPRRVTLQLPVTVGGWGSRTVQEQIDVADRQMENQGYVRVRTKDQLAATTVTYAPTSTATADYGEAASKRG